MIPSGARTAKKFQFFFTILRDWHQVRQYSLLFRLVSDFCLKRKQQVQWEFLKPLSSANHNDKNIIKGNITATSNDNNKTGNLNGTACYPISIPDQTYILLPSVVRLDLLRLDWKQCTDTLQCPWPGRRYAIIHGGFILFRKWGGQPAGFKSWSGTAPVLSGTSEFKF